MFCHTIIIIIIGESEDIEAYRAGVITESVVIFVLLLLLVTFFILYYIRQKCQRKKRILQVRVLLYN